MVSIFSFVFPPCISKMAVVKFEFDLWSHSPLPTHVYFQCHQSKRKKRNLPKLTLFRVSRLHSNNKITTLHSLSSNFFMHVQSTIHLTRIDAKLLNWSLASRTVNYVHFFSSQWKCNNVMKKKCHTNVSGKGKSEAATRGKEKKMKKKNVE